MLHSTGSHQIRLLLYVCASRKLLSVICVVMCTYIHLSKYCQSSMYNDDSKPFATYIYIYNNIYINYMQPMCFNVCTVSALFDVCGTSCRHAVYDCYVYISGMVRCHMCHRSQHTDTHIQAHRNTQLRHTRDNMVCVSGCLYVYVSVQ